MTETLIDPALLEIMQCPADGGPLTEQRDPDALVCGDCGRQYPVRDGIPVMLIDEALPPS
jgi:uncharacterized protein YbaR (Trm112 family)